MIIHKSAKAGRMKWLDQAIKKHGSTTPERLEERRQGLTEVIKSIDAMIAVVQRRKDSDKEMTPEKEFQYNSTILAYMIQRAKIETGCLIFDSLSIRCKGKGKRTQKLGYYRETIGFYGCIGAFQTERMANAMSAIANMPDSDSGADEEVEVEDEEIYEEGK